jgi:DNA-binding NarL/FixJ family response regulator
MEEKMAEPITRSERLLALLLIRDLTKQTEKVTQLNAAGFSNVEIAALIGTTNTAVAQTLYESKKGKQKKK